MLGASSRSGRFMAQEGTGIGPIQVIRGRPGWALAVVGLGLVVLALSAVPAWLLHSRVVGGEGYRTLTLGLNAWQLKSVPVLSLAAVTAGLAGIAAMVPRAQRWLPVMVAVPLGLLAAGLLPLSHEAHVTSVAVTPGWALFLALAAVAAMLALVQRGARPPRAMLIAAAAVLLAVGAAGGIGRFAQLQEAEAVSTHWSPGTYGRQAGAQEARLTLTNTTYASGPWRGALETAGISIILTGDAGCPEARGFYHVRAASGDAILVEKVIDTCADGDRAAALEGTWTPIDGGTGTP